MRKLVDLTTNDFAGVNPAKFEEFKIESLKVRKNLIIGSIIFTVLAFWVGSFLPASASDFYVIILFGVLMIMLRMIPQKNQKLMKEMGITYKMIIEAQKRV